MSDIAQARDPAASSAEGLGDTSPGGPLPMGPAAPKQSVAAIGLRHKYSSSNHSSPSISSLTGMCTREHLADEVFEKTSEGSDSESCLSCSVSADSARAGARLLQRGREPGAARRRSCASRSSTSSSSASSSAGTDHLLACGAGCLEERLQEVDEDASTAQVGGGDGAAQGDGGPPLLDLDSGLRPAGERPRCPPKSWLAAAGFELPTTSAGFGAVPVAPVAGERPTRYLDLFSRQLLARHQSSELRSRSLAQHDAAMGRVRHTDVIPATASRQTFAQDGVWLEAFLARARATPLCGVAVSLVGDDLANTMAGFLDGLSDVSSVGASLDGDDAPDGTHVMGSRIRTRGVHRGRGRAGFYMESDTGISTPGRSQSPAPDRGPAPLPTDLPSPPLIRALDRLPQLSATRP